MFFGVDVGSMPLEDVVLRVSPLARQTSFELPRQAIRAIETSPEWRGWNQGEGYQEPEWREGLCGITLLPVDELRDLHFAPWIEDRPCLVFFPIIFAISYPTYSSLKAHCIAQNFITQSYLRQEKPPKNQTIDSHYCMASYERRMTAVSIL